LRRFQHDRDLKELTERKQALEDAFERLRGSGDVRRREVWERAQELTRVDHALRRARRTATLAARGIVDGLADVLERYDYLREGRPTYKAPYLRSLFDTNALTLSELLVNRQLEGLAPAELAEALSWFATDRDNPMRSLALTRRLHRLRELIDHLHGGVLREEERHGLQISQPLPVDFHGVALAWAEGTDLAEIARRARMQEGDLVGALQKTLDLVGQLRGAAQRGPLGEPLLPALEEADRLLRRGVVEASYRWAVGGPPGGESEEEPGDWDVPLLFDEFTEEGRRGRRPPVRGRAPGTRGSGAKRRQAQAAPGPGQGKGRGDARARARGR
jgi:superfamily II RNA helicase